MAATEGSVALVEGDEVGLRGAGCVVERLDLPSGEHAYVPCAPAHHHHVVCSRCGRAAEVEDCGVGEAVQEIARRTGYRIDVHRLELFGLCRHCQAMTRADT